MIKLDSKGLFIIISGPSGVGKGTICQSLIANNPQIKLSVSATTREKRKGEINGVNYYFLTKEAFEKDIAKGEFLEYAIVHNNEYYGTPKSFVLSELQNGHDIILEIDINGALQIKKQFPNALFIFIMPPTIEELKSRLLKRGTESKEKLVDRFKNAYKEINEIDKYNYVVVNDDLNHAIKKVQAIIDAEKCKVSRIEELDLNTVEEEIHEIIVELKK
ncbi:MAG: guanylate kinase [Bacilli bacterium]|nr:guanylate kinase [Bacilli bacterium]